VFRRSILLPVLLALLVAACTAPATGFRASGVRVVAAENFWGSIAAELGGPRATVVSIVRDPAQDPHSYEPTATDARTVAAARLAIVNGIGYDPWAAQLLAADSVSGQNVITVGGVLGLADGANPHRWYSPSNVDAIASSITADLQRLDAGHAAYYARRLAAFESAGLARYHAMISAIRARYAGVPVGASESIFALQAPALGLDLITPPGLMRAVSEGTDVTAQDTRTAERQINSHLIKVWVYNSQNATPLVQELSTLARTARIPVVPITETLDPPSASFEQWQVSQLERLDRALHEVTG
jgi:zinc/manganese transport system substrate-binding protein